MTNFSIKFALIIALRHYSVYGLTIHYVVNNKGERARSAQIKTF